MKYSNKKSGTITVKVMCAVVFLLFTFCWLYGFQADMMAVLQHRLSDGQTTYSRTIGAVLITAVLWVLQLLVSMMRVHRAVYALTFLPSMLVLAVLSAGGLSLWVILPILLLWGFAYGEGHRMRSFVGKRQPAGLFSRCMWVNLLQMAALMLGVAWMGNTNAVMHYRAHAEVALLQGQTEEALRTGWESMETDASLTMLRAYALAQRGEMGDRLFAYPIGGTSNDLLPGMSDGHAETLLLPADSLWLLLGGRPATPMTTRHFLDLLARRDTVARTVVGDYRLCASLIDRDLQAFARLLPVYYAGVAAPSMPRHYREALLLHQWQTGETPSDSAMLAQWQDYLVRRDTLSAVDLHSEYETSYWYYYREIHDKDD